MFLSGSIPRVVEEDITALFVCLAYVWNISFTAMLERLHMLVRITTILSSDNSHNFQFWKLGWNRGTQRGSTVNVLVLDTEKHRQARFEQDFLGKCQTLVAFWVPVYTRTAFLFRENGTIFENVPISVSKYTMKTWICYKTATGNKMEQNWNVIVYM